MGAGVIGTYLGVLAVVRRTTAKTQNEMGGACGAYRAGERGAQGSGGET